MQCRFPHPSSHAPRPRTPMALIPVCIYQEYFALVALCTFVISLLATHYPGLPCLAPVEVPRYE